MSSVYLLVLQLHDVLLGDLQLLQLPDLLLLYLLQEHALALVLLLYPPGLLLLQPALLLL